VPVAAAGALLAAVIAAGVFGGGDSDAAEESSAPTASALPGSTVPSTESYTQVVPAVTADPVVKVPLGRTLAEGVAGDDVQRVQTRLVELGFDPGPVDVIYGLMTIQSVWAFEKLILGTPSAEATGRLTPEMWDRMQDPITIAPRRPLGNANHVEIYLPEQVMVVFHSDAPRLITHIASGELDENGEPKKYCETIKLDTDANGVPLPEPIEKAICGYAKTPGGIFDVDRFVPGTRNGPLGSMWNPIYFNYGIAIHGAKNVPLEPASHGCVRIPMHISEYTQSIIAKGDQVYVWNGKKEPEQQTREDELPSFDFADPDATTTTTSTTTTSTTTTTTLAPTTTKPPSTTAAPATTPAPTTTAAATTTVATTTTTVAAGG
jgi:hypothetical protein